MSENRLKNKLISEVENYLLRNNISLSNEALVLGVSCGVDSMVLLDIFLNLQEKYNFQLNVCHVNHKRRAESELEEAFIKEYLADVCPLFVLHFDENENIENNFQEIARNKRLAFFKDTLKSVNGKYLVLAHHLNDDIETSFMHLLRSGSLESISGIKEVNRFNDFSILRPLIRILKEEIYQYANENKVKYFEDSSNSHDDYTRNRIRHNVVSEMFKENPSFGDSFINFKEKVDYASKLLNDKRDELINKNVIKDEDSIRFDYEWFKSIDNVLQNEILFELLKKEKLSINNINEIINIIYTNKVSFVNKYLEFTIIKDHNFIVLTKKEYAVEDKYIEITGFGRYDLGEEYDLIVKECENSEFLNAKKTKKDISNINILWYNSIRFPLCVRRRQDGDQILLSSGHKKVKDLLIDLHLSAIEKDKVLLLTDNSKEVISVLGYKKGKRLEELEEYNVKIELIRKR